MFKPNTLKLANTLAFTVMVYLNYLSNALPINGNTAGELSDKYVNYFVPAGLTFAIWGVIYSWLFVFIGFQIISIFNENLSMKVNPIIEKIGWFFVLSCGLNIAWLLAWHYEKIALSVIVMCSLLGTLLFVFLNIGVGKTKINQLEKWISHAPFSIYLGWISIATIANFTAFLVANNWNGFGVEAAMWAKIMITIGFLVCFFVMYKTNAFFFGLVVMWAFYGIYLKRSGVNDAESLSIAKLTVFYLSAIPVLLLFNVRKWFTY